jgi:hypothetical protein
MVSEAAESAVMAQRSLSDLAINGDGTLHLIKGLQGLATLEWHGKKLDIYAYVGAEYAGRTASFDPSTSKTVYVGYGSPFFSNASCYTEPLPGTAASLLGLSPSCTADTRAVIEGTAASGTASTTGPRADSSSARSTPT